MKLVKTIAALCALLLFFAPKTNAQMYVKGQQDLHLGIGLGTTLYGSGYKSILPPINIAYEKGITKNIGVGGYLGYATSRSNHAALDYSWRHSYTIIGARAAYHYDLFKKPKLDTYGGAMQCPKNIFFQKLGQNFHKKYL